VCAFGFGTNTHTPGERRLFEVRGALRGRERERERETIFAEMKVPREIAFDAFSASISMGTEPNGKLESRQILLQIYVF